MNARYLLLGAALRPWLGGPPAWQSYPSLFVLGDGPWYILAGAVAGSLAGAIGHVARA